jgi:hypothetical protein
VIVSHEKAVNSAFSVSSHSFRSPDLTQQSEGFGSTIPSIEPRCPMKTITVPTMSKTTPPEPMLEHAIRLRAYELYAQRGKAEGHAVQDWIDAENELLYSHSDCGKLGRGI